MRDNSSELQAGYKNGFATNGNNVKHSNGSSAGHTGEQVSVEEKPRNFYELSCNILCLSFLEEEDDIYTVDDLKEKY